MAVFGKEGRSVAQGRSRTCSGALLGDFRWCKPRVEQHLDVFLTRETLVFLSTFGSKQRDANAIVGETGGVSATVRVSAAHALDRRVSYGFPRWAGVSAGCRWWT